MNIQGITGNNIQVRQIKPEQMEAVKKAAQGNDLDEIIVSNDKGSFLIYGEQLSITPNYVDKEGAVRMTNLSKHGLAPQAGEQVNFGELKGTFEFIDDETDARGVGGTIGGVIGGVVGLGVGWQLMSDGTKIGDAVGFVLGGGSGAMVGALMGIGAGMGLTHLIAKPKPDASALERLSSPLK